MPIQINIPPGGLKGSKIYLGVPMYGGMCTGTFATSTVQLGGECLKKGVDLQMFPLFNESLITRARNYICDSFMRSDAEHLMFIDADIGYFAPDVLALLALQKSDEKYDIIGAPYPKKTIAWEKVKSASDQGFGDDDPNELSKYVGDFVFNPKNSKDGIPLQEPAEVLEIGTGFMMIHRRVFEKFNEHFKHASYRPDHIRTAEFDGSREVMQYFQAEIDIPDAQVYLDRIRQTPNKTQEILGEYDAAYGKSSKRYLSEDFWFCQRVSEIGCRTWMCPWMNLSHMGSYNFSGSLMDLARAGVSGTADASIIKGNREKATKKQSSPPSKKQLAEPIKKKK